MEISNPYIFAIALFVAIAALAYLFWRYIWFFRNPERQVPKGESITSPADGTVVYVKRLEPGEAVISIKKNKEISVRDIVNEDLDQSRVIIGVFMSPFNVHYNRAPVSGVAEKVCHHPAKLKNHHMTSMHWRSVFRRFPLYKGSSHIVENERVVTRISGFFKSEPVSCHVVQIAGGSVKGIESRVQKDQQVIRGEILGMIRVGSQVDTVVSWIQSMRIRVEPGSKVRAGESILIE